MNLYYKIFQDKLQFLNVVTIITYRTIYQDFRSTQDWYSGIYGETYKNNMFRNIKLCVTRICII